ncbi:GAF domain-containing sensor histidine kinase [Indiicoccus explosivorum]|uniref:GAF domain-containing sensor histidine kinase n=1 Tax=Indiicoccus explosivorum TaxID=1917864 RepID=UPI001F4E693E|nr:sensor histidine kinase [Indiicoccus explosivorum]
MKTATGRQRLPQWYMAAISAAGWTLGGYSVLNLPAFGDPVELLLLMVFLFVCEYYPMPFPKGSSSLSFPVVYLVYLIYGFEVAAVLHFLSVLAAALLNRRPARIVFFNPAQFVLSLGAAHLVFSSLLPGAESGAVPVAVLFLAFICVYYIINNTIVDLVLIMRPEKYPFAVWAAKTRGELFSFAISLVYGFLLHFLGGQTRREPDVFTYFFFLSPLMFLSILSSVIIRLRADKQRLKALFDFSSELNRAIPAKDWEGHIREQIRQIVSYEECFLLIQDEKTGWQLALSDGTFTMPEDSSGFSRLEQLRRTAVYNKPDWSHAPLSEGFRENVQTAVYAPLTLDDELIGCLILTKTRTRGFTDEDVRSSQTAANQLAIFLKTKWLFNEKEQRVLLEERNRIAHGIHDGIAQTLAGAVMKLDTAAKKIGGRPEEARKLVEDSSGILRDGLKEVRNSIYSLRPTPPEELGLHAAIENKISGLRQQYARGPEFTFRSQGTRFGLSLPAEKTVFSIMQESVQNAIKHANAARIDVLLRYQHNEVFLKIKDDGIGFSLYEAMAKAMKEPHYGIIQMNESAAKIGAVLQIDSSPDGTEITMRIPKTALEGEEAVD